jgi:hypothetical protein
MAVHKLPIWRLTASFAQQVRELDEPPPPVKIAPVGFPGILQAENLTASECSDPTKWLTNSGRIRLHTFVLKLFLTTRIIDHPTQARLRGCCLVLWYFWQGDLTGFFLGYFPWLGHYQNRLSYNSHQGIAKRSSVRPDQEWTDSTLDIQSENLHVETIYKQVSQLPKSSSSPHSRYQIQYSNSPSFNTLKNFQALHLSVP